MQNQEILQNAADQARGLAIDAIHACSSGHLGLPLGAAEVGAVLFGQDLKVDPSDSGGSTATVLSFPRVMEVCSYTDGYILLDLISPLRKSKISVNCIVKLWTPRV